MAYSPDQLYANFNQYESLLRRNQLPKREDSVGLAQDLGKAKGEKIFGAQDALTPISSDILRRRLDLAQGLNAQELSAARQQGKQQIQSGVQDQLRQLQAIQGRQGIKGGSAASQQSQVLRSGADQQRKLEQDLLLRNIEARRQGIADLESDVGRRQYGVQASEAGEAQMQLAKESMDKGLAIASMPAPIPKQGFLGNISEEVTVICTELNRQGLLPKDVYQADAIFGAMTITRMPHVYIGYHAWAQYVAKLMKKSKLFTKFVCLFAIPWAYHMAYSLGHILDDNKLGRVIHTVGFPLCGKIGKLKLALRKLYAY